MVHYAYLPTPDGKEPLGTSGKIISRRHKTDAGFVRFARSVFNGKAFRAYRTTNFYRESEFRLIHEGR